QLDSLVGCGDHGGFHQQGVAQVGFEDGAALLGVGAVEANHDRDRDVHPAHSGDDAVGDFLTLGDAAEDVDEDRLHGRVVGDDLEGTGHDLGVGAAADVEEVGGLATHLVDDVDGRHGQAGAVGDHTDAAFETDVLKTLGVG